MFRRLTPQQLTIDVVVAVLCVLLRSTFAIDNLVMAVVILGMAGALAIRRLSPGLALGVAWVSAIVLMLARLSPDISTIAILAVLYATARYGEPLVKWLGLVSAGVGALVATVYVVLVSEWFSPVVLLEVPRAVLVSSLALGGALAVLGLSWTLGLLVKTWRTAAVSKRERLLAEQTVIVEQERNRIARDMHDIVAHSLAVVIAQSDGARYAAKTDPEAVDSALTTISFEQLGDPLTLPTAQQLAIYRIVQEALTNALRHGDVTEQVDVTLTWTPDAAELTISSALRDPTPAAGPLGHGIAGMRERALLVGGTLTAGPDGDRFVVRASIPTRSAVSV